MNRRFVLPLCTAAAASTLLLVACGSMGSSSASKPMSFFITSTNPGKGGDFGGVAGADRFCQALASNVGAGGRTWRAYVSAAPAGGQPAVNARDRIGTGPWTNAKGVVVATSLADLHGPNNNLGKQTSLSEKGDVIPGRGDPVNMHDILTGSKPDGTLLAAEPGKDTTCGNWTRSVDGSAMAGHHDKTGTNPDPVANVSWNSSHGTRGCSIDQLKLSGSAGLLYCFATN
ncbi:MAG: hypothetical protein ABWZ88_20525 [Variovorax sp.]